MTSTSAAHAKSYYVGQDGTARGDYYGQEMIGNWGGILAQRLGLEGAVQREDFAALCENRHPHTGERLTQRTTDNRRVGYDFNFHAPKSVSVLYALTRDARILTQFRNAVRDTMNEMESEMQTRVRVNGQRSNRCTGNLAYAEFVHFTARPVDGLPDPHLHIHAFVPNATYDPVEDKIKAGEFSGLKRDAHYFEKAFHASFAQGLVEAGYAVERTSKGWELAGVPQSVNRKFSRRTAEIEQLAAERAISDPAAKDKLGAATRETKSKEFSNDELRMIWEHRLSDAETGAVQRVASQQVAPQPERVTPEQALRHAIDDAFERKSVVSDKEVKAKALQRGVGAVSVSEVHGAYADQGLIERQVDDRTWCTTADVLAEERRMLEFARAGKGTCKPLVGPDREITRTFLSDDQQRAVRHVWESNDRVVSIAGGAGTGKTTLMKECIEGIEAQPRHVHVFAPSADASRGVLRDEGFEEAETVAKLLSDRKLQDQTEWGIIWIDEAGQLGSRTMAQVFEVAEEQNARVILSGDTRQHGAVERGDAMRVLDEQAGIKPVEVRDIVRQRGAYKEAVHELSQGRTLAGYEKLDKLGFVEEVPETERYRKLAEDYVGVIKSGRSALVVSPTHAEGAQVTSEIRGQLKDHGALAGNDVAFTRQKNLNLTAAERSDPLSLEAGHSVQFVQNVKGFRRGERVSVLGQNDNGDIRVAKSDGRETTLPLDQSERYQVYQPEKVDFSVGETIRITQNGFTQDKQHRLNNGAMYQIKGFTDAGDIQLQNDWIVDRDYGHLNHGYCTTSHASQGKTVDVCLEAQSSESFPASSQEQFYVSASRARQELRVYTDDKQSLQTAIQNSSERMSATELSQVGPPQVQAEQAAISYQRQQQYQQLREPEPTPTPPQPPRTPEPEVIDYER